MATILLVEDDRPLAKMSSAFLREAGHTLAVAADEAGGLRELERVDPQIVITDLMLERGSGLNILREARARETPPEVILVTAHATSHTAAQAMQEGAYEYVTKPYSLEEIGNIVKRIEARLALVGQAAGTRTAAGRQTIVADSASMRRVLEQARDVAPSATTVMLRGESGTGKEIVARYIHEKGPRHAGPFVAVNCGAIPENLLESELFGHEKGAFTGADARRPGAFERAHKGTLLLDEIGDISPATQIHLLRVLETREVTRVGGAATVPVDVRLIASTHQDLEGMLRTQAFREDLYYRLNVFAIKIPPLRERREDVRALVDHFLTQWGSGIERVEAPALELLTAYGWPGNVRELRNVTENLQIRARGGPITADRVRSVLPTDSFAHCAGAGGETLQELETRRIREALEASGGNKTEAAHLLGISRRRMYSRLKILGIE